MLDETVNLPVTAVLGFVALGAERPARRERNRTVWHKRLPGVRFAGADMLPYIFHDAGAYLCWQTDLGCTASPFHSSRRASELHARLHLDV